MQLCARKRAKISPTYVFARYLSLWHPFVAFTQEGITSVEKSYGLYKARKITYCLIYKKHLEIYSVNHKSFIFAIVIYLHSNYM